MSILDSKVQNTFVADGEIKQRGVGTTPVNNLILNKMFCKIAFDYLSFTFPYSVFYKKNFQDICKLLFLDEDSSIRSDMARNGYKHSLAWKNDLDQDKESYTYFYSDGGEYNQNKYGELTGQFELSGDGCRALEMRGGDKFPNYWKTLFDNLFYKIPHVAITRFDFAIDVFNADFTLDELQEALINKNILSPFLKFDYSKGSYFKSDEVDLHIIDLGSKSSDLFLCIYDKKEEREAIGKTVDFKSWYRFEFRYKHQNAKNFILNMLNAWDEDNCLGKFAGSLVLKYCDVKLRPKQGKNKENGTIVSNKQMYFWKTDPNWLKFIGCSEKAVIENYFKYESSIVKNANWYVNSVSKVTAKLFCANPDIFWFFIQHAIIDGGSRLKTSDIKFIDDFRKKKELKPLTGNDIKEMIEKLKVDLDGFIENSDLDVFFDDNGEFKEY